MKKFAFALAAVAAVAMVSCSGNKAQQNQENQEPAAIEETFEEQQIKAGMKVQLDSLTQCWLRLKPMSVVQSVKDGKVVLTDEEKKVKPSYLLDAPAVYPVLETLSQKYRALVMFDFDREIAKIYDMADTYKEPMEKITVDINDPAVKYLVDNIETKPYEEVMNEVYRMEEESGRANLFWECAATAIIEQLWILTNNQEKFLASFTDKDAEDITFHVAMLIESYAQLAEYNANLRKLYNVILPLDVIDAITVEQLRAQLTQVKNEVAQARATLLL